MVLLHRQRRRAPESKDTLIIYIIISLRRVTFAGARASHARTANDPSTSVHKDVGSAARVYDGGSDDQSMTMAVRHCRSGL